MNETVIQKCLTFRSYVPPRTCSSTEMHLISLIIIIIVIALPLQFDEVKDSKKLSIKILNNKGPKTDSLGTLLLTYVVSLVMSSAQNSFVRIFK